MNAWWNLSWPYNAKTRLHSLWKFILVAIIGMDLIKPHLGGEHFVKFENALRMLYNILPKPKLHCITENLLKMLYLDEAEWTPIIEVEESIWECCKAGIFAKPNVHALRKIYSVKLAPNYGEQHLAKFEYTYWISHVNFKLGFAYILYSNDRVINKFAPAEFCPHLCNRHYIPSVSLWWGCFIAVKMHTLSYEANGGTFQI